MFFAIIVIIIAADQFTKYLISANYAVGQSFPLYKDLVYMTSVRNTGAAYNILQDHTRILTYIVAGILAVILLYVLISWKGLSKTTRCAFAMILGGGFANLIDRYFLGYVVDFIDIKVIPVFNIADIFICVGCGLLVLDVLIIEPIQNGIKKSKEKKAKKKAEKEAKAAEEAKLKAEAEAKAKLEAEEKARAEAEEKAKAEAAETAETAQETAGEAVKEAETAPSAEQDDAEARLMALEAKYADVPAAPAETKKDPFS